MFFLTLDGLFLLLYALNTHLTDFAIVNIMNITIITDRGSNFTEAFPLYEPVYCVGCCSNNVSKVCFFQQHRKKTANSIITNDISAESKSRSSIVGSIVK